MADDKNASLVVPIFKIHTQPNEAKSKAAGRPIFDDLEIVEIRFGANKQTVAVFPAHEVSGWVDNSDGTREEQTYAMRYPDQYRKFKNNEAQTISGTPLSELPFLTQAKRYELKALNIHTAEALAALDGAPLKTLGMGGRELKNQAMAYLENAAGSADVTKMAGEIESLKETVRQLLAQQKPGQPEPTESTEYDGWSDADLKSYIEHETGSKPRGNPSHATLVGMVKELATGKEVAA